MFIKDKILEQAVEKWGVDAQLFMVAEECAELIQAVSKYRRYEKRRVHLEENKFREWVVEEIVDVYIMLKQLEYMLEIKHSELQKIMDEKTKIIQTKLDT